ncbi:hypothetical protein [Actinokineospora inagensis]|uniref:hypothetical protein n=1 Tax=Actinokineospora inagensis TaxID=103730 RepID=UPI000426B57B|nr:hypothetical protein [Actinokineospora inagensis]
MVFGRLVLAVVEFFQWGFRDDVGSLLALLLVFWCLGLVVLSVSRILDLGPVGISGGRLEFWEKLRRWSIRASDVKAWRWVGDRGIPLGAAAGAKHLVIDLANGRRVTLRHRWYFSGRPSGIRADELLVQFFGRSAHQGAS